MTLEVLTFDQMTEEELKEIGAVTPDKGRKVIISIGNRGFPIHLDEIPYSIRGKAIQAFKMMTAANANDAISYFDQDVVAEFWYSVIKHIAGKDDNPFTGKQALLQQATHAQILDMFCKLWDYLYRPTDNMPEGLQDFLLNLSPIREIMNDPNLPIIINGAAGLFSKTKEMDDSIQELRTENKKLQLELNALTLKVQEISLSSSTHSQEDAV